MKLNLALNRSESTAYEEGQERRHEAAAAAQHRNAESSLDFQTASLRAQSIGHDSNLNMPAADDIARVVLDVLRPDQEQIARDQKRIEDKLSDTLDAKRETLGSQRNVFALEMSKVRSEILESKMIPNSIDPTQTSWRDPSPTYLPMPSAPSVS